MSRGKHSYVPFYMDDWYGGTTRMTRLVKSVYFDVCLYTWDKAQPVPEAELMLMLDDLGPQGEQILNMLVKSDRLERTPDGSVYSKRALAESQKAFDLWQAKSGGGKRGSAVVNAEKTHVETPVETAKENQIQNQNPSDREDANASLSVDTDETPLGGNDGDGEEQSTKPERKTYDVNAIAEAWNAMAVRSGLAQIKKMTDERRRKVRARLEDYPEADVLTAISLVPERPFCLGQNNRGWKADIDWFLRPDTVVKLLEGVAYTGDGSGRNGGWRDA